MDEFCAVSQDDKQFRLDYWPGRVVSRSVILYRERAAYLITQNVGVNEVMISTYDEMNQQIKELLRQYEFAAPPEVSYLTASENQIYISYKHIVSFLHIGNGKEKQKSQLSR